MINLMILNGNTRKRGSKMINKLIGILSIFMLVGCFSVISNVRPVYKDIKYKAMQDINYSFGRSDFKISKGDILPIRYSTSNEKFIYDGPMYLQINDNGVLTKNEACDFTVNKIFMCGTSNISSLVNKKIFSKTKELADKKFNESTTWKYLEGKNKLSDQPYYYTYSKYGDYKPYIQFMCDNGVMQFSVHTNKFINLRSSPFRVDYRIGKNKANHLILKTFSNSIDSGYTEIGVLPLAKEIINNNKDEIYIRINVVNGDTIEQAIDIKNSRTNIQKVFNACGLKL